MSKDFGKVKHVYHMIVSFVTQENRGKNTDSSEINFELLAGRDHQMERLCESLQIYCGSNKSKDKLCNFFFYFFKKKESKKIV